MADPIWTTRRQFLRQGLTLVGAGATVPGFIDQTALALAGPDGARAVKSQPGVPDDRILVVVQMAGGNDGLNTVIPFGHDIYRKSRPKLAIPADEVLRINDDLGFHPQAAGLKSLYDDGLLAVVQGVGYPNANRSHFKSTDIWETASPEGRMHTGWIGRYFDHECAGSDPCPPQRGVALKAEAPLAMQGEAFRGVTFTNPQSLQWRRERQEVMFDAFKKLGAPESNAPMTELAYLRRTALDARLSATEIRAASRGEAQVNYPQFPFAQALRNVGRMIASEMPTRIYYVSMGGFDTHSGQTPRHRQLMTQLAGSLRAFISDLADQGNLDRVVVMTFSEFGRRVTENASGGTDHGEAAPMFLIGTKVAAGVHGTHPDLENLHRGDLAFNLDFRRVYASVLGDWLEADAGKLLGRKFDPLKLIRV
jgi:uncharacterized protein (DUF1501 family)